MELLDQDSPASGGRYCKTVLEVRSRLPSDLSHHIVWRPLHLIHPRELAVHSTTTRYHCCISGCHCESSGFLCLPCHLASGLCRTPGAAIDCNWAGGSHCVASLQGQRPVCHRCSWLDWFAGAILAMTTPVGLRSKAAMGRMLLFARRAGEHLAPSPPVLDGHCPLHK